MNSLISWVYVPEFLVNILVGLLVKLMVSWLGVWMIHLFVHLCNHLCIVQREMFTMPRWDNKFGVSIAVDIGVQNIWLRKSAGHTTFRTLVQWIQLYESLTKSLRWIFFTPHISCSSISALTYNMLEYKVKCANHTFSNTTFLHWFWQWSWDNKKDASTAIKIMLSAFFMTFLKQPKETINSFLMI